MNENISVPCSPFVACALMATMTVSGELPPNQNDDGSIALTKVQLVPFCRISPSFSLPPSPEADELN